MNDEGANLVAAGASVSQSSTQLSADAAAFVPSPSSPAAAAAVATADTATAAATPPSGGQQQLNDPAIIASIRSARSSTSQMTQSRVVDDANINTLTGSLVTSPGGGGYLVGACSPVDMSMLLHQQHQQQQQHRLAGTWQGPGRPASLQQQPCFTSINVPSQETYLLPTQYPLLQSLPAAYLVPAPLSNYQHHLQQQQQQQQSYQFLSPVEPNSPDTYPLYAQPFSSPASQLGQRILVGHQIVGLSNDSRPGASAAAAAAAGGSQLQRMVEACSPLSDCSRSRHCHHHHHHRCSKTEQKDRMHRRDRFRKKTDEKSCGVNKVNVGVQYEAENKQNIYSPNKCQDSDTQTDFPDDLAKSFLLDRPSPLYAATGDSSAEQDETDYCSTDSAELDSDSGYGAHRHSRSSGLCQRCCARLQAPRHQQYLTFPPPQSLSVAGGGYPMQSAAAAVPASSALYLVPRDAPPPPSSTLTQPPPSTRPPLVTRQTPNVRSAAGTSVERPGKRSGRRAKGGGTAAAAAAAAGGCGGVDAGTTTNTPRISERKTSSTAATAEIPQTAQLNDETDDLDNVSRKSSASQQSTAVTAASSVTSCSSQSNNNKVRKNRHREVQRNKAAEAECMEIVREQNALVERYFGLDGVPYSTTGSDVIDFDLADERRRNIHSQLFRDYCTQLISSEINECCMQLLQITFIPQGEAPAVDLGSTANPDQQVTSRRAVIGLREVVKHLSPSRLVCVIVAPNIDKTESKELDETLMKIVHTSEEQQVPVVFALGRKSLGRACCKPVPVSIVGITTITDISAQKCLDELLLLAARERMKYRKLVDRMCEIDNDLPGTLDINNIDEHSTTANQDSSTEVEPTTSPPTETSFCPSQGVTTLLGKTQKENAENNHVLPEVLKCSADAGMVRHHQLNGFTLKVNGMQRNDVILTDVEITVENKICRDLESESVNSLCRVSSGLPDFLPGMHMNGKPGIDADNMEHPALEPRLSLKDAKCFTAVETSENERHQRQHLLAQQWLPTEPERITDSVC